MQSFDKFNKSLNQINSIPHNANIMNNSFSSSFTHTFKPLNTIISICDNATIEIINGNLWENFHDLFESIYVSDMSGEDYQNIFMALDENGKIEYSVPEKDVIQTIWSTHIDTPESKIKITVLRKANQ